MIKQFINPHRTSNNWLVNLDANSSFLIDVGNFDQNQLFNYLREEKKKLIAVIITHEHADHTYGLQELLNSVHVPVYCTAVCAKNIGDKKQNFSYYLEDIDTFEYKFTATTISDFSKLNIEGNEVEFFETPGHSPGGLIVRINRNWFTGDTILNHIKTPLNFPHSNKRSFNDSLAKVLPHFRVGDQIFPGHGEPFLYNDTEQFEFCTK